MTSATRSTLHDHCSLTNRPSTMKNLLFCFALAMSAPVVADKSVSPEVAQAREARKADIEHWLTRYDGYELRSGEFSCRTPRIPQVSKDNAEIEAVGKRMTAWQLCYNRFADNLNKSEPPEQRIPKDLWALMNAGEREKAVARIKLVQAEVAQSASVKAKLIMADYEAWRIATDAWVSEHNATTQKIRESNRGDYELRRNNYAPKGD